MFARKKRRISRLLVVEDEPLVAFDTERFLTDAGFEIVATVDTVSEALRHLTGQAEIDLVLLDLKLSDGSGIEVAEAAHACGTLVLFVTGSCPGEAQAIAEGCLSKPYPQRDLLHAIDAVEAVHSGRKPPKRLPASFNLFKRAA